MMTAAVPVTRRSLGPCRVGGSSVIGKLQCVVPDCPDVLELARFYQALLGGAINQPDRRWAVGDDFATLHSGSGLVLAFQRVKDYRAPRWPDGAYPQQFHLDVDVPDLEPAQEQVLGDDPADPGELRSAALSCQPPCQYGDGPVSERSAIVEVMNGSAIAAPEIHSGELI
jgi:hypothetical protein